MTKQNTTNTKAIIFNQNTICTVSLLSIALLLHILFHILDDRGRDRDREKKKGQVTEIEHETEVGTGCSICSDGSKKKGV